MQLVMGICDRIIVLCSEKLADGDPAAIANNREVIDAYLGGGC